MLRSIVIATFLAAPAAAQVVLSSEVGRGAVILELAPVQLPAGSHDGIEQPPPLEVEIPASGWYRGFQVELLDGEARSVPRQVIHHINVMQPERRDLFAPVMMRLFAVGQETADFLFPWFFGIPLRQGTKVLVTAMFHNPTQADYRDVRLRLTLPYRPTSANPASTPVLPFYLDVMPHGGFHSWDLPPGRSERSWEGRPAIGGRILGLGAHLHRYGVLLRLEDVTAGRVIWEVRPEVDAAGEVTGVPTRVFRVNRPRLDPRRTYRLTAVYDNPTGEVIPDGAMGALGGAILPDDLRRWPAADPDHPEYVKDLEFTMVGSRVTPRGGHGAHEGHQH